MVPSYLVLAFLGLLALYAVNTYRALAKNILAAKQSGISYIVLPVYTFNRAWLITHRLWLPFIDAVPAFRNAKWRQYIVPEFAWAKQHDSFKEFGSDMFLLVSPGANTLFVADAEAMTQITTRRNDFPKPIWMYTSVDLFGKSVVSTEGHVWRHHRKVTSPPFTERNNHLVWHESLRQAEGMMAGWLGKDQNDSGAVLDVATESMRLSLHVISLAGFGVQLHWPHEGKVATVPEGHTMTYKDALETLLHNLITIVITPRWLLPRSPLKLHKTANEAYVEWGKYMREMYQAKRQEVRAGEGRGGMDLMGALVKGAGLTQETLNVDVNVNTEKAQAQQQQQQLPFTDEDIMGNSFVFILAGHETAANTIHFSILFLAMHMSSQRNLQTSLDSILGSRPCSSWDYDSDMPKLFGSMCGAVMNEQLRLIPPVIGIPKTTPKDSPQTLTVEGKSVTIPENTYVTLNTTATHRNPRYWPHNSASDLLEFRPERWLLDPTSSKPSHATATEDEDYATEAGLEFDQTDKKPDTAASLFRPTKGAYLPFSEGYRSCLGRRFAQVEILAVLAVIFKTWTVELDVSEYLSDEEFAKASESEKREAWKKADARARELLKTGMMTIITIQMRAGKVPFRFVKRGSERFGFL
ncbi:putative cytochrome P450 [Septoria linicola]|nr:putative cytochrome P450 [Septoria linicola]